MGRSWGMGTRPISRAKFSLHWRHNGHDGPLTRYVKLRVGHTPGMPRTFSLTPRVSDPDMHHGTCVTHVPWCMSGSLTSGFLWSRWRRKTFPAFPAHTQPVILRICQEAHGVLSKSPASPLFAQLLVLAKIKENTKAPRHWRLWGEFTGDRWIHHTKDQLRAKCFHLMTSSCVRWNGTIEIHGCKIVRYCTEAVLCTCYVGCLIIITIVTCKSHENSAVLGRNDQNAMTKIIKMYL